MSNIPPPSEPKANKKITLVSVRLSDEELKRFEETVELYRARHKSRHPKRGITYSDVLRAAIEALRYNLDTVIKADEALKHDDKYKNWDDVPDLTDEQIEELEKLMPRP